MCKGMGLFFGKKEVCRVVFDRRRRHLGIESGWFDDFYEGRSGQQFGRLRLSVLWKWLPEICRELAADYKKLSAEYEKISADYEKLSADYEKLSAEYEKLSAK